MLLAIAFTFEARICVVFVDSLSFEMREPRLNVAGWDEDRHSLTCLTSFIAHFGASVFDLSYSVGNVLPVGIDEYNQRLFDPVLPRSVVGEFLPEPFAYELLT